MSSARLCEDCGKPLSGAANAKLCLGCGHARSHAAAAAARTARRSALLSAARTVVREWALCRMAMAEGHSRDTMDELVGRMEDAEREARK